jgi:outer membrane protein assembly factor BamA
MVKVEEIKGQEFDDLIYLVRPIPNKKFMDIFPIKVSLWAYHQPKFDSISGITKDSKTNRWLREKGEPPVLVDTNEMQRSINQIQLAMFQHGYFDAQARAEVHYRKKQKARVNYFVSPNRPYYIRKIEYEIDIPEYKRIVMTDTAHSLLKKGMIYDEELFVAERSRIVSAIRDQGYFYANADLVTFLVDSVNACNYLYKENPTVSVTVKIAFDEQSEKELMLKSRNRYRFNDVLIYTNYDLNINQNIHLDTVYYYDFRAKNDSTLYKFITLKKLKQRTNRVKLIKDYHSRTIAGTIWMKKGDIYTQTAFDRTQKKLRDLRNFSIINIAYNEEETLLDTINNIGALNTTLRLTRAKQHSIGADFDLRTDRTTMALYYTNKNIFRGAEYLKISGFGSVYYYKWFNSIIKNDPIQDYSIYGEVGGSVALEFPRLLLLPKYQNINLWSYSTEIRLSCSYSQYLSRLNLQAAYTYRWAPRRSLSHAISPVELTTLDSRSSRREEYTEHYPESYQRKFEKFFLPSSSYTLRYEPNRNRRNVVRANFSIESAGLLLYAANLATNKDKIWKIFNSFNYGMYEKFDLNFVYTHNINHKNAFAMRFMYGMAIPFKKGTVIPFEKSFFVGGAGSMRGWSFRQLGPGGFSTDLYPDEIDANNLQKTIERVGDMRMELNLEYRGTIYKAFKFGVFSDIGNVWLLSKYEDMPNAEFHFNTFYKQIAVCVGLGLHLDFNFFLVRLDYGLPIYDPSKPIGNYLINKSWVTNSWWKGAQGIQFGINYAF